MSEMEKFVKEREEYIKKREAHTKQILEECWELGLDLTTIEIIRDHYIDDIKDLLEQEATLEEALYEVGIDVSI